MTLSIKSLYKTSLLLLFFFGGPFFLFSTEWATIIQESYLSIGRVILRDSHGALISQGSGFIVSDNESGQLFVTNAHVIRDAWYNDTVSLKVLFDVENGDTEIDSGQIYEGHIEKFDTSLDIGIIRLNRKVQSELILHRGVSASLMSDLVVAGYPLGKNFKATPGLIQAFQSIDKMGRMIDMSAELAPGNSGGPVLNSKGEVIGIATAIIPGYNFNLAIPVINLIRFLDSEKNGISLNLNTEPEDARVFINGVFKGETPTTIGLLDNQYSLKLEKPGFIPNEQTIGPWGQTGEIRIEEILIPIVKSEPLIWIKTFPAGAEVFVSNQLIGESPVSLNMSSGRMLRIRVQKGAFKEGSAIYRVTDELEQTLEITLD